MNRTWKLCSCYLLVVALLTAPLTSTAWGVCNELAGIEAHACVHDPWNDGGAHHHHYHDSDGAGPPPDAVPLGAENLAHQLSGNTNYDAYSVWVNETYHYFDDPGEDSIFSHGFIQEVASTTPEYEFIGQIDGGLMEATPTCDEADGFCLFDDDGEGFDPRPLVRDAFALWSGIEEDDPHLRMGLAFREKTDADAREITVRFADYFAGAVARWDPEDQILEFRRYADAAMTDKHQWFIGDEADLPDDSDVDDFLTVALHEVGHIVGLEHQTDIDDVMYTLAGRGDIVDDGGVFRGFSQDDILGARDLYSIPIPEPGSLVLLALAGLIGGCLRRKD